MENVTMIEKLTHKIDELLKSHNELKLQNEELKKELLTCQAASQKKDEEIKKLQDELAVRDLEIEEVVRKIENFLG